MFTSDHLSHTNYCVCQSDNYLQSHSKNHAIKFIIMAAFNYKRQEPTYRKFTEGYKMVLCHYFNFKSEQFIWQSLFKSEKKTLLKYSLLLTDKQTSCIENKTSAPAILFHWIPTVRTWTFLTPLTGTERWHVDYRVTRNRVASEKEYSVAVVTKLLSRIGREGGSISQPF